jgi:hypothetical protein
VLIVLHPSLQQARFHAILPGVQEAGISRKSIRSQATGPSHKGQHALVGARRPRLHCDHLYSKQRPDTRINVDRTSKLGLERSCKASVGQMPLILGCQLQFGPHLAEQVARLGGAVRAGRAV